MDNFFNNKNNKVNENEELLDEIMEQQKKRDDKIAPKGYLLKDDKKEVSVFKQADVQNDDDNVTNIFVAENYQPQDRGEPMFIIDDNKTSKKFKGKGTTSSNATYRNVNSKKKLSKHKKLGIFILSCFLFVIAFVGIAAAIIFTENHYVKITCGYLDGVTLTNANDEVIENINLKLNKSFRFHILVNDGYKNDSVVTVTFNDLEVKPDVFGFYTIKNTNNVLNLHIGGIRPDKLTLNLEDNGYFIRDRDNQVVSLENKEFKTNDILTFRVVNNDGDNIETNTFSVYYNNTLQTAGSDRFYNVKLNKTGKIQILPHSAYEFFDFSSTLIEGKIVYNIIGLTSLGETQEKIYFPDKYNGAKVYIKVDEKLNYPAIKCVGIPKSADYVEPQNFNAFIYLESFEVFNCYESGVLTTENGMLVSNLYENALGSKKLTKKIYVIPQSLNLKKLEFIKNEQSGGRKQIYSFNKNCFYNLNNVKEVTITADDVIFADAGFNGLQNKNAIKFNITSKSYKTTEDGKTILKADDGGNYTILFGVPYYDSKYVIPEGVTKIGENAFAYTKITEFDFSKVTSLSLSKNAFAKLLEVTSIKLPSFVTSILDNCFLECVKLETVDLTELSAAISVSTSAFEGCYNLDIKILVKSELLDAFKTANPNIESMFTTLEQNSGSSENNDNQNNEQNG